MATAGKKTVVAVSTDGTLFNTVAEMNDSTLTLEGDNQDTTVFGDEWRQRIQGLKDGSWSISGFWKNADTNGQLAIQNSLINDSALWVRLLFDGTHGFSQPVKVSSFEVSSAVDGVVEISIDFEGNGTPTVI